MLIFDDVPVGARFTCDLDPHEFVREKVDALHYVIVSGGKYSQVTYVEPLGPYPRSYLTATGRTLVLCEPPQPPEDW